MVEDDDCQRQETRASNTVWSSLQANLIDHLGSIRLHKLAAESADKATMVFATIGENGRTASSN